MEHVFLVYQDSMELNVNCHAKQVVTHVICKMERVYPVSFLIMEISVNIHVQQIARGAIYKMETVCLVIKDYMEIDVTFHVQGIVKEIYAILRMDFVNHATLDGMVIHVTQVCCFIVMHLYLI